MALADFAEYTLDLKNADQTLCFAMVGAAVAARPADSWKTLLPTIATPTTAVACDGTTNGDAFRTTNAGAGHQLQALAARVNASVGYGTWLLCDRLSHQGGLSGTTTGAQTTNLPTAALTRYTDGVGVMLGISIYTVVGTTATTITATYTNQDNTGSRTTPLVVFGGTGFREANRMILLPLQSGDYGVRSVQSVTIAASTATAGAFGVTLFKPLFPIHLEDASLACVSDLINGQQSGGIPTLLDNACPFFIPICSNATHTMSGTILLSEN